LPDAPQPVAALAVSAIFIAVSALAESVFPVASLFTFVNGGLNRCVNSFLGRIIWFAGWVAKSEGSAKTNLGEKV